MKNDFYKRIPRDIKKNLRWRLFVLKKAKDNPELQQALWLACAADAIFYTATFVFQCNPKAKGEDKKVGPFVPWPYQVRAILSESPGKEGILWCIKNGEDLVVEKSREMGITWIFLICMDWLCRFQAYHDSIMISKSAKAVDEQSRQSLFGKLRFIHEHLPKWLHDPDPKKSIDNKNVFIYDKTKSTTTGQASTGKAGVSERGTEMFIDEFQQIEEDWAVLERTAATTNCRLFNGTHLGLDTALYALTQSKHIKKLRFHWTQHPKKNKGLYRWNPHHKDGARVEHLRYNELTDDIEALAGPEYQFPPDYDFNKSEHPLGGPHPGIRSPWYDKEFERVVESIPAMAREQDINPSGSVSQFYTPLVIKQLSDQARPPLLECDLEYDAHSGQPFRLTEVKGGKIKLWCNIDVRGCPPICFYGAGVDVSGGTGCTPSCISMWRADTGEKILEFMDPNIYPDKFGVFCCALCRLFASPDGDGAMLAWENHGPGVAFGKEVWDRLAYRRVYRSTLETQFSKRVSDSPGWVPTAVSKLIAHTSYRKALYDRAARNYSRHSLDETLNFKEDGRGSVEHTQYKNTKDPVGGRENHGDIVVADMLGWKMIETEARANQERGEEDQVARPGTIAWYRLQDERTKTQKNTLYANWQHRGRRAM